MALFLLAPGGLAVAAETSLTLEAGPYSISKDAEGFDRIFMDGFRAQAGPGEPLLPCRTTNVILPQKVLRKSLELKVIDSTSEVLPGQFNLRPAAPDAASAEHGLILDWGSAAQKISGGRNIEVYETSAFFPASSVELLPYSQLRKWKFARVSFRPFQYNPVTGELRLVTRIRVEISYQLAEAADASSLNSDTVMDPLAAELFDNFSDGGTPHLSSTATRDSVQSQPNYTLITTNATVSGSSALADFIAHKEARGYSVLTVTETDFEPLTGQAPNHRAEKIRQWLINHYMSLGIEYVLLIGDPHPYEMGEGDIPMKLCWPRRGAGEDEDSPTDAFYADLTGNWDADGDGYYGELNDYTSSGGVDLSMEVWVGRIPVYNEDFQSLDGILMKIIAYEEAGSPAWRKNVLLPMSFSTSTYDGAHLSEQMQSDFLDDRGYTSWTQYQQGSGACALNSAYSSSEELRGGTSVRNRWAAQPFGIVCWWGHGNSAEASVGCDGCWDGTLFSVTQTGALNDNYPAFTYQCSCTNGYPESSNNLQFGILKKGGIATVSATRLSWLNTDVGYGDFDGSSTNSGIGYEYAQRLTRSLPAGRALYAAKLAVAADIGARNTRLMNQFDFNLYGDPSVRLGGCETSQDCDDGLWCNGSESCEDGLCAAGTPVDCADGNSCTRDLCDEEFDSCDHPCSAAGPEDSCCLDAACQEEPICQLECLDEDGDGYGNPASVVCPHQERDCDDTNPEVNPGAEEIPGNGINDDCSAGTPPWGVPASILGMEYGLSSVPCNYLLLVLAPAVSILLQMRFRRRA